MHRLPAGRRVEDRQSCAERRTPRQREPGAGDPCDHSARSVERHQEGRRQRNARRPRRAPPAVARCARVSVRSAATAASRRSRFRAPLRQAARPAQGSLPRDDARSRCGRCAPLPARSCPASVASRSSRLRWPRKAICRATRNGSLKLRHAFGEEKAERVAIVAKLLARHDLVGEDAKLNAVPLFEMRLQRLVRIVTRRKRRGERFCLRLDRRRSRDRPPRNRRRPAPPAGARSLSFTGSPLFASECERSESRSSNSR